MYQAKPIFSLFVLLIFSQLAKAQSFSATQLANDAYIDLNWSFDVDPCLLDANDIRYDEGNGNGVIVKLLANGSEISSQPYTDLSAFFGPDQPDFDHITKSQGDLGFYYYDFSSDPAIQAANNYTIEMWMRTASGNAYIFNDVFPNSNISLIDNHAISFRANDESVGTVSFDTLRQDSWNHFAFAANGLNQTLVYVNGQYVGTINYKFDLTAYRSFGGSAETSYAQLRVWNRLRTNNEISSNYLVTNFNANQADLLIHLKHANIADSKMEDFAMVDGVAQTFVVDTQSVDFLPYEATPFYTPLVGSFRHNVGPDQNVNYQLRLAYPPLLFTDVECGIQNAVGSTLPYQTPTQVELSNTYVEKITLGWKNNSTLTTTFTIKRDNEIITTYNSGIAVGDTFFIEDIFEFDESTSIKNGQNYDYTIETFSQQTGQTYPLNAGVGSTLPIQLEATDIGAGLMDKIELTWSSLIMSFADKFEIRRNDDFVTFLDNELSSYTDFLPIYGMDNDFEFVLWRDDEPIISVHDIGTVPPNGKISGRVITQNGNYPVNGVSVKAEGVNGSSSQTVTTNQLGEFEIEDLTYGLIDSFTLTAISDGDTLTPLQEFITLTRNNAEVIDVIILADKNYEEDVTTVNIQNFSVIPNPQTDAVNIAWSAQSNTFNVFVEITRDGEMIFQGDGNANLSGSVQDLNGVPGNKYKYQIRVFTLQINKVREVTETVMTTFPEIAVVPTGQFSAVANNNLGNVELAWTHTSTNIAGFVIYRNGELLAQINNAANEYIDTAAIFNLDLSYEIGAIRTVDNIDFESENLTMSAPATVNLGAFPAPQTVNTTEQYDVPSVKVDWVAPNGINLDYNFTGYRIYRGEKLLNIVYKDRPLIIEDRTGLAEPTTVSYYVSAFRLNADGSFEESDKVLKEIDYYPQPPRVNGLTIEQAPFSRIVEISIPSQHQLTDETNNIDGYRLYRNGNLIDESSTFIPIFRDAPRVSGNYTYEVRTFKKLDGQIFVSDPASQQVTIALEGKPLLAPTNLTVSRDLTNHVKLCWDYDESLKSEFVISRVGQNLVTTVLDTLPTTARSYYDYSDTANGFVTTYQISAINSGFQSDLVHGFGEKVDRKAIFGTVYQKDSKLGVPNVDVRIYQQEAAMTTGQFVVLQTTTDSTGFYYFESDKLFNNPVVNVNTWVKAFSPNSDILLDSFAINFDLGITSCQINFEDDYMRPIPNNPAASVEQIGVTPDTMSLSMIVHWNTDNEAFSNVEVNRGLEELDDVGNQSVKSLLDSTSIPGIEYKYGLRTIQENEDGRTFSNYNFESATVPKLMSVINLTGTILEDENQVLIQWSHKFNNADIYVIVRTDVVIGEVDRNSPFQFFDKKGVPGTTYNYSIVPLKNVPDGQVTADPVSVTVRFPSIAKPVDLVASVPMIQNVFYTDSLPLDMNYTLNHVVLNWTYADTSIEEFRLYRNGGYLQSIDKSKRLYRDFSFNPSSNANYSISATKIIDGKVLESSLAKVCPQEGICVAYPALSAPSNFDFMVRDSLGDVLFTWEYLPAGADGFEISRLDPNDFFDTTYVVMNDPILENQSLSFADKYAPGYYSYAYGIRAFTVRDGIKYYSDQIETTDYIFLPVFPNPMVIATDGEMMNAVKIEWVYPEEIPVTQNWRLQRRDPNNFANSETIAILEPGQRSFVDSITTLPPGGKWEYRLWLPYTSATNGTDNGGFDLGHPALDNAIVPTHYGSYINTMAPDVYIDSNLMFVCSPTSDRVTIYKFYPEPPSDPSKKLGWNLIQEIQTSTSTGRFSYSVDYADNVLVLGNIATHNVPHYSAQIYEYDGDETFTVQHQFTSPNFDQKEGWDVATDNRVVIFSDPDDNVIKGLQDRDGDGVWTSLTYTSGTSVSSGSDFGWSIDLYNDTIVVGAPYNKTTVNGVETTTGSVEIYYILNNSIHYGYQLSYDFDTYPQSDKSIEMGWDLKMSGNTLAVSAPDLQKPNTSQQRHGGVLMYEKDANGIFQLHSRLFQWNSVHEEDFGYRVDLKNDLLIASRPNVHGVGNITKTSVFKRTNGIWGEFDITRPEFQASATSWAPDMGRGVTISETHAAITGSYFETRFIELYPNRLFNVQASDGVNPHVNLTWEVESDPALYSDICIYRDNELIAVLPNNALSFEDKPANILDTASVATIGRKYMYEVRPRLSFGFKNQVFSDEQFDSGYTNPNGTLSGLIYVDGTSIPVENVEVTCSAMINEHMYSFKMTTGADGAFLFDSLPYANNGTIYEITPQYLDHEFELIQPFTLPTLRPNNFVESSIIFYDKEAYTIFGEVKRQDARCGLEDIKVVLCKTVNGNTVRADSTFTQNGNYSFAVNPQEIGVEKLSVFVPNIQTFDNGNQNDLDSIRYGFKTNEASFFTNLGSLDQFNEVNFTDTLNYPVLVQIQNTCGAPVSSNTFDVRIYTSDGCYDEMFTSNQSGIINLDLPVNNYLVVVNRANGNTNDDLLAAEYLSTRPANLNIKDVHDALELEQPTPFESVKLTYHKAATFGTFNNAFDRYICDDNNQPAIITQGEQYSISLSVSESFIPSCQVGEGYIVVRNAAADSSTNQVITFENGGFADYKFTAGFPNLVAPYLHEIVFSYFSTAGDLLATTTQVVIVEGERSLPGSGIVVEPDQDEDGQVKLPMIILRDPPGDQSYTKLETGGSYKKSYEFDLSKDNNGGFYTSGAAAGGVELLIGGFWEVDARWGRSTSEKSSLEFTLENVESFSTSISEEAVGREANVIVGAGFASQYGLTQRLEVIECDSVSIENKLRFGLSDMATTWSYTVKFIENLIKEQVNDSLLIDRGLKNYFYADGTPYSQEDARIKVSALIQSWRDILQYHDVESVPYYALCNSGSYLEDVDNISATLEILKWRNAFCSEIGSYDGHQYVMDESISWEDNLLVTKYNNTIAAIEALKAYPSEILLDENVKYSTSRFTNTNYNIASDYHNTLGADESKSAEIFDVSGQVLKERTVTTNQSGSASYEYTGYSNIDVKGGFYTTFEGSVTIPFVNVEVDVFKAESKVGFAYSGSSSEKTTRAQADENTSSMYYRILDGDEDDQVSFLVMQGPMQNHSPYFIRLGGKSSCPAEEALTLGNDADPISIDNPYIAVGNDNSGAVIASGEEGSNHHAPPVYNIPIGDVAEFDLQIANNSSTTLTRDIEIYMPIQSNPNGAIVTLNGVPFGLSGILIEDVPSTNAGGGPLPFTLRIERPSGDDYDFENIAIGVRPGCDGDEKFVYVSAHFQSPCSPVSLTSPIDGFVVNREKVNDPDDRELIRFTLRDYQSTNANMDEIQLQYQRLGTGIGWENVPFGLISRNDLATNDAMLASSEMPVFFFDWDITGQYDLYPDGQYALRAVAVCNAGGDKYSNEITGEIRRTEILTGDVEPADGIWSVGDEISIAFSQNLDCGLLSTPTYLDSNFSVFDLTTGLDVAFELICQNNKLIFLPSGGMSQFDGHIFEVKSSQVRNIQGNFAQDESWTFRVVTQDAEWKEELIEVYLYEGGVVSYKTELLNTSSGMVPNLSVLQSSASASWMQVLPEGTFDLSTEGLLATLNFTGSEPVGIYDDTLVIAGLNGRIPEIPVRLHILQAPPQVEVSSSYGDSMLLVINWRFEDELDLSADTLDQIQAFIGNDVRGMARIDKSGPFYQAAIWVHGEAADEGTPLGFQVWNSDEGSLYAGERIPTDMVFEKDAVLGATHSPEVLIVETAPIVRQRIYVDMAQLINTPDGSTWGKAFSTLNDALAIAMPFDTIWMAEGNYFPTDGLDRNATFDISMSVIIYGGFVAGQSALTQRTGNSLTVLSGDIGVQGDQGDNSYHVIKSSSPYLILDGIDIIGGKANGVGDDSAGGAILNTGNMTIRNGSLQAFGSSADGSVIFNSGSDAKLILQDIQLSSDGTYAWINNENGARMTVVGSVE